MTKIKEGEGRKREGRKEIQIKKHNERETQSAWTDLGIEGGSWKVSRKEHKLLSKVMRD